MSALRLAIRALSPKRTRSQEVERERSPSFKTPVGDDTEESKAGWGMLRSHFILKRTETCNTCHEDREGPSQKFCGHCGTSFPSLSSSEPEIPVEDTLLGEVWEKANKLNAMVLSDVKEDPLVQRSGWLWKKQKTSGWKARWFVLKDNWLYAYRKETSIVHLDCWSRLWTCNSGVIFL